MKAPRNDGRNQRGTSAAVAVHQVHGEHPVSAAVVARLRVRRGKAGLFFYSGVTAVSVVRLLIARSLADEYSYVDGEDGERGKQNGDTKADSST